MFGHGSPMKLKRAPSVPPRIGRTIGLHAGSSGCLFGILNQMVARTDLLSHVAVLLFDLQFYRSLAVFFIHCFFNPAQILFFCCKFLCIVITDDVLGLGMCHIAGHTGQMIEAFISFGISRGLCFRQKRLDLACNSDCIDHRVFLLRLGGC